MRTTKSKSTDPHESPTAWFCVLEVARKRGDHEQEQRALRELERLGVHVSFGARGAAGTGIRLGPRPTEVRNG